MRPCTAFAPLHFCPSALLQGREEAVAALLQAGADPRDRDAAGRDGAALAEEGGHWACATLLSENAARLVASSAEERAAEAAEQTAADAAAAAARRAGARRAAAALAPAAERRSQALATETRPAAAPANATPRTISPAQTPLQKTDQRGWPCAGVALLF